MFRLIKKIFPLLVFSLIFESNDITNAKDNSCNYQSIKEFKDCLNSSNFNLEQKFPAYIGDGGGDVHKFVLYFECPNGDESCLEIRKKYKAIRLTSQEGNNIEVGYGHKSQWTFQKFKIKDKLNIPSKNIISWNKKSNYYSNNWTFDIYNINYIDKSYNLKNLYFLFDSENNYGGDTRSRVQKHSMYVDKFLKSITKLENSEVSNKKNQKILNRAIKEMEIIKSIILIEDKNKDCFELNETKFPDLVKKYRKISNNIYPLKEKFDISPSSEIKPICN